MKRSERTPSREYAIGELFRVLNDGVPRGRNGTDRRYLRPETHLRTAQRLALERIERHNDAMAIIRIEADINATFGDRVRAEALRFVHNWPRESDAESLQHAPSVK